MGNTMMEDKFVHIKNQPIKVDANIKSQMGTSDDPVRIKSVGGRRWVIAGCAMFIALFLDGIYSQLKIHNDLYRDDLNIKKEQLELARRQYVLDSLRYYHPPRTR